jgi:hypothetical protein
VANFATIKRLHAGSVKTFEGAHSASDSKNHYRWHFLCSTIIGTGAPAEAKQNRYQHHHLYWPGHYFRPYADTPGLTGLIHH